MLSSSSNSFSNINSNHNNNHQRSSQKVGTLSSLREEAALRAATLQPPHEPAQQYYQPYDHGDDDYYESFPQRPTQSFAESSAATMPAAVTVATASQSYHHPQQQQQYQQQQQQQQQYQQQQYHQQHSLSSPLAPTTSTNTATVNTNNAAAQDARKEWRQHGTGLTQVLQDQASTAIIAGNNRSGIMARVISHANRVDLGGHPYTAYVIQVTYSLATTTNNNSNSNPSYGSTQIERRYSDFDKLNTILEPHLNNNNHSNPNTNGNNSMSSSTYSFPSKHWAGSRWGKRLLLSEERQQEISDYRVIQLDVWMVQVLRAYNSGQLLQNSGDAQMAVYNFLFSSQAPCDHALILNTTPTTSTAGGTTSTATSATSSTTNGTTNRSKFHNPWTATLGSSLRQALHTLQLLTSPSHRDASIPCDLLRAAQGLLFLTVVKGGFVVSGRVGTGLIVSKLSSSSNHNNNNNHHRWSAPCAISVMGVGWGALVGGDVTHYLVVLTTQKATYDLVGASSSSSSASSSTSGRTSRPRLQLGAELGVAVGPIGRGANSHLQTGDWTVHPAYAYAISQGLFVGMSLEGSILNVRDDVNAVFYGQTGITASQILQQPGCKAAEPLYQAIEQAIQVEIPDGAFRPSQFFSSTLGKNNRSNSDYYHYPNNNNNNHAASQPRPLQPQQPQQQQQHSYYYSSQPAPTPVQPFTPYTHRV